MKISSNPKPMPKCVYGSPGEVRWVIRHETKIVSEVSEKVLVLQQQYQDGWGNPFWADVQIHDEEDTTP